MGVHGLWELLATVGCRVSVEALSNKKLAIDASIWIVQFMKAMRDERGDMIRNAHLLGFFRRICKLLFLRVKPVFVFDGGTPALKRRTVLARRRQREMAQAKIRKTAEKLLLNHLRTKKLEEIVELRKEETTQKKQPARLKETEDSSSFRVDEDIPQSSSGKAAQEAADALLAQSLGAEWKEEALQNMDGEFSAEMEGNSSEDDDENEELILLPAAQSRLDPTVLASLPPSMQLDLLIQMREQLVAENRQRFQKVAKEPSSFSQLQIQAYLKTVALRREVDEAQRAASVRGIGGVPSARIASESDREFIFSSASNGKNVSKPPDVEELTAASTATEKETIKVTKKTNDLLSNLASTSAVPCGLLGKTPGVEHVEEDEPQDLQELSKACSSNTVQTYVDEKGKLRVSRVRAMGVRMTRDLQWNLYLIKDKEAQILGDETKSLKGQTNGRDSACLQISFEDDGEEHLDQETKDLFSGITFDQAKLDEGQGNMIKEPISTESLVAGLNTSSYEKIQKLDLEGASGSAMMQDNGYNTDQSAKVEEMESFANEGAEDLEWEEGEIELGDEAEAGQNNQVVESSHEELVLEKKAQQNPPIDLAFTEDDAQHRECEVEWEDEIHGTNGTFGSISRGKDVQSSLSKFEEAQLEEAIRRSLEDYGSQGPSIQGSKNLSIEEGRDQFDRSTTSIACDFRDQAIEDLCLEGHLERGKALAYDEHDARGRDSEREKEIGDVSLKIDYCTTASVVMEVNDAKDVDAVLSQEAFDVVKPELNKHKTGIDRSEVEKAAPLIGVQPNRAVSPNQGSEHASQPCSRIVISPDEENCFEAPDPEARISGSRGEVKSKELAAQTGFQKAHAGFETVDDLQKEDIFNKDLLREAEETDLQRERQDMAYWEEDFVLKREELAKEKAELQVELQTRNEMSQAQLEIENEMLIQEESELRAAQKANERNADSVTGEMFAECQELLQMFGVPYVIAPMEAEAQCAFMDSIHLVDGVVTDDSDVFLFGGRNVYKNIFDDRKYVETYYMKDIEAELGIDREKLIHMALLLGSDYTEGVSGIGIVNAVEVVNAFPGEDGLKLVKEWLDAPDLSLLGKFQFITGKKGRSKKLNAESSHSKEVQEGGTDDPSKDDDLEFQGSDVNDKLKRQQTFMDKHRAVSKNWNIPDSFPNRVVIAAYTSPQVDKSSESFTWGRPDLEALRKFCSDRFGWSKDKADESLLPVLREYDRRETQLRLEAFYSFNQRFAKIRSRRIQKAVTGITGRRSADLMDLTPDDMSSFPAKKQRKMKSNQATQSQTLPESSQRDLSGSPEQSNKSAKVSHKENSGVKAKRKGSKGSVIQKSEKKPKKERKASLEEASSSDTGGSDLDNMVNYMGGNVQGKCRRSKRVRSHVKYTCDDSGSQDSESRRSEDGKNSDVSAAHCFSKEITSRTLLSANRPSSTKNEDQGTDEAMKELNFGEAPKSGPLRMQNGEEDRDYLQVDGGFVPAEEDKDDNSIVHDYLQLDGGFVPAEEDQDDNSFIHDYLQVGGGFVLAEEDQDDNSFQKDDSLPQERAVPEAHDTSRTLAADFQEIQFRKELADTNYLQVHDGGFVPTDHDEEVGEQDIKFSEEEIILVGQDKINMNGTYVADDPQVLPPSVEAQTPPLNTRMKLSAVPFLRRRKQ